MPNPSLHVGPAKSRRVLEPVERISEVLFGLIMVLTFTGTFSAAGAERAEVRELLIGALGCNLAWGLIDAVMYLMACLSERAGHARILRAVRRAPDAAAAHRVIAEDLHETTVSVMQPDDFERVRQVLLRLPEPPQRAPFKADDWRGACAVFLWVFVCTFPVVLPFVFVADASVALRVSNGVAVVMMFGTGYAYGRCAGLGPLRTGVAMLLLGMALVALTIALGG